jgi:hypothetical protein
MPLSTSCQLEQDALSWDILLRFTYKLSIDFLTGMNIYPRIYKLEWSPYLPFSFSLSDGFERRIGEGITNP